MKLRNKITSSIILVAALTFASFSSTLDKGFTNWDDNIYVTENDLIKDISWDNVRVILGSFYKNDYRLITVLFSYALEYRFFQLDPFIYHLDNLILHILNTLLVLYLTFKISNRVSVSLVTSLLFGVHPIHVESVAWVSERKGLLSAFFFLQAIICYLLYEERKRRAYYYLSLSAFVLSLLSKLVAVTLPLVLLLFDYLNHRALDRKKLLETAPYFVISGIFAIDTVYMYEAMGQLSPSQVLSPLDNLLVACRNIVSYLVKTVLPVNLSAIYPSPREVGFFEPEFLLPLILVSILAAAVFRSRRYTRTVVFGGLFFLINLLPVVKLVPFASGGSVMADRYMYVPSMGLFYMAGLAFCGLYAVEWGHRKIMRISMVVGLGIVVATLSVLTHERSKVWKDSETLWLSVIEDYPGVPLARNNLGVILAKRGQTEEAMEHFRKALEADPGHVSSLVNLGVVLAQEGRLDEAIAEFARALRIEPENEEAKRNLERALRLTGAGEPGRND